MENVSIISEMENTISGITFTLPGAMLHGRILSAPN